MHLAHHFLICLLLKGNSCTVMIACVSPCEKDIDGSLSIISQLRPVNFDWKDPEASNNQSGFIAQEVKTVIPDLVVGEEYDESKDGLGYAINTSGVVAHLTKALQEAITKIETLETKVAALEAG